MAELNEKFEFEQDGKTYNLYDLPKGFVIKDDLDLFNKDLTELPDLSGVIVEGDFSCSYNRLTSLKGAPQKVGGSFVCSANRLTSLNGAPQEVGEGFYCNCNQLTSLEGAPQKVGGCFDCHDNELFSLKNSPLKVSGDFICSDNRLESLEGAPKEVGENFVCELNELISLVGISQMKEDKRILCDHSLAYKYGFKFESFTAKELYENQTFQNEAKIDELRQKKHQEDIEKRTKTTEKVQSAFDAWLKQNGKNTPEK